MEENMGAVEVFDRGLLPLEEYFPDLFEIHEYNATENRTIRSSTLNDDLKGWLRDKCNKNFVFQCLLCQQEMTFQTVFWRGNYPSDRSHLLTKKHKQNVEKISKCVGILFLSSQKFVICIEKDFSTGNIFNVLKTVKRQDRLLDRKNLNRVFCQDYSIYSFDREKKILCQLMVNSDIVLFMRDFVRPLFIFHCLICNSSASSYKVVVDHLLGNKHIRKLKGKKAVLISIKDFNVFISCDFDKLTSFMFLEHLNSYLEEIVVASDGCVLISGHHTNDDKRPPNDRGIQIDVSLIKLPNGQTKKSINVTTRFNRDLIESSEKDSISNELVFATAKGQKNVIIYEFSVSNFQENYIDNILHVSFDGCKIWCSRCRIGLFTLHSLQSHLFSPEHVMKVRGNEQTGFMCHFCNIFFIELKGSMFYHAHTSRENKNIVKRLGELAHLHSIEYVTPINKCVTKTYTFLLKTIPEAIKFCCIACFDVSKQKLMYLGYHETTKSHREHAQDYFFTYCRECNVIYIDKRISHSTFDSFKFHFLKHLHKDIKSINYTIYNTANNESVDTEVINKSISLKNVSIKVLEDPYKCRGLIVRFNIYFMQFHDLGVSSKDFVLSEQWDNNDFKKYTLMYESVTGEKVEQFECKTCYLKTFDEVIFLKHLFLNEHQSEKLIEKNNFIKVCDLCKMVIWSDNPGSLQEHFIESKHVDKFSSKTGISSTFTLSYKQGSLSWLQELTKGQLKELVDNQVDAMRSSFLNRTKLFCDIKRDLLALLNSTFSDVNVEFYGSRLSGLALPKSDFDLYLNLGNENIEKVANILSNENKYFKLIMCLKNSNVPLIRAKHKDSGMECDILVEANEFHAKISRLVRIMTRIDVRVLWLLAAVRYWAKHTELISTNMFSGHAITWLVLFYLMQPDIRIIPSVGYVIEECGDLANIPDDIECVPEWTKNEFNKEKTGMDLLQGFFEYYSSLKFSKYKLQSRSGLVTPRNSGEPDESRPMILMDPLDTSRNLFYRATKAMSEKLTATCYMSLLLPWRLDE